jgi:hypothetical protein
MIYFSVCVILLGFSRHIKYNPQKIVNLEFIQEFNPEIDNI